MYRDPELASLYGELQRARMKTIILEEENQTLRSLLRKELPDLPTDSPPGFLSRMACKFLGNHRYTFSINRQNLQKALDSRRTVYPLERDGILTIEEPTFTRQDFFNLCQIECSRCGKVEKTANETWTAQSMDKLIQVAELFLEFYTGYRNSNFNLHLPYPHG